MYDTHSNTKTVTNNTSHNDSNNTTTINHKVVEPEIGPTAPEALS